MNRTLHIERVYTLGDYKSIRFSDTIEDLPQELCLNEELIGLIRYLQMINVEMAKDKYLQLNKKIASMSSEEELAYLEELRVKTLSDIKTIMNGHLKGE